MAEHTSTIQDVAGAPAPDGEPMLVSLISTVPGFSPPLQDRSSKKTRAIIAATLSLLQERSANAISMQDIAERAGCAVTAIYARFADRDVLFSAIHMLQLQECRPLLAERIRAELFSETGLFGLACAFIDVNEFYFNRNFNFVVAQLRSDSDSAYRVTRDIMAAYTGRLASVAAAILKVEADELAPSMELAIHTLLAIYRDSVLGQRYFARPSREVLASIFVMIVEERLHGAVAVEAPGAPGVQP